MISQNLTIQKLEIKAKLLILAQNIAMSKCHTNIELLLTP